MSEKEMEEAKNIRKIEWKIVNVYERKKLRKDVILIANAFNLYDLVFY